MRKFKKSFQQRREELRQALYRIDGAINRYKKNGEMAELGIIAIELRGLLLREALFISLAEEKDFSLELFTIPPATGIIREGLTHYWVADSVSLTCKKPWTRRVTIQQWLKMPVAEIKGSLFTPQRLITEVASSLGPAHYSPEMSVALAEMTQYRLGGIPSHFRTLFNFAELLLEIGKRFLATF